mmetsp:Transcript_10083/g.40733  ORF Transcript_10083/g.40733 Transcript_10083/m.40733 type:complete len:245 (-) Transcript_10083:348-1082(-)
MPVVGRPTIWHARRRSAMPSLAIADSVRAALVCFAASFLLLLSSMCRLRCSYTAGVAPGADPGFGRILCASPAALCDSHSSASRSSSFFRFSASSFLSTRARSACSCAAFARAPTVRSRRSGFGAFSRSVSRRRRSRPSTNANASFRIASSLSSSSILTTASSAPSITRGSVAGGESKTPGWSSLWEPPLVLGLPTGFKASRPLFALATCCLDWPMASASFGLSLASSSIGIGQWSEDRMETPA